MCLSTVASACLLQLSYSCMYITETQSDIHATLDSKTTQIIKCFSHLSLCHLQVLQINDTSLLTKTKAVCHLTYDFNFWSKLTVKPSSFIIFVIKDTLKKTSILC